MEISITLAQYLTRAFVVLAATALVTLRESAFPPNGTYNILWLGSFTHFFNKVFSGFSGGWGGGGIRLGVAFLRESSPLLAKGLKVEQFFTDFKGDF